MKYKGEIIDTKLGDGTSGLSLASVTIVINFLNDDDPNSFGGFTGQITLTNDDDINISDKTDDLLEKAVTKVKTKIDNSTKYIEEKTENSDDNNSTNN